MSEKKVPSELSKLKIDKSVAFGVEVEGLSPDAEGPFLRSKTSPSVSPTPTSSAIVSVPAGASTMATYSKDDVDKIVAAAVAKAMKGVEDKIVSRVSTGVATAASTVSESESQTEALIAALKNVKFTSLSSKLPVPKFDTRKMSAAGYLADVERYYTAQGHSEQQFLYLVKTVLPSESQPWFEHILNTVTTWDEFKDAFIDRYDNWMDVAERTRLLHTRRQQLHEPTEHFIYDMVRSAKLVYPHETTAEAVMRAKLALYPRLRTALGTGSFPTVESLFEACRVAHANLSAEDRINREKYPKLPPIVKVESKNSENEKSGSDGASSSANHKNNGNNGNYYRGRGNYSGGYRGSNYRGRGGYHNQNQEQSSVQTTNGSQFTGFPPNHGDVQNQGQSQGQNQRPSVSDSSVQNQNQSVQRGRGGYRGNRGGSSSGRGNGRGNGNSQPVNPEDVQCYKCSGYGHRQFQCPTNMGAALGSFSEAAKKAVAQSEDVNQAQGPSTSTNLKEKLN